MSPPRIATALVILGLGCAAVMVLGAARDDRLLTSAAAAAYALAVSGLALWTNAGAIVGTPRPADQVAALMLGNVRLAAFVYAWGGAAMLAVYHFSGLHWRHGWQYGLAMILIAAGLLIYARRRVGEADPVPLSLTLLHAAGAIGGLAFLIGTGKLATLKNDWAANTIFLNGGLAILAICLLSVVAHIRSSRTAG
ncbi:MAG: hypothetical protein ACT4N2_13985 [Hyphomicrobium sp.]